MPQNFIRGDDPGQGYLLPPDAREWLPARHLAWELLALAREMDLAPFTSWYRADGQGHPAYHPAMMVTLAGYCFCKGIRSSRAIEMATFDDVGARVICANLHPDHSTIHRFLTRHEEPVKRLLVQSVVACAREGLVSVDVVAGDGTKVKANASMAANATLEQLDLDIGELEALAAAEVDAWIAQAAAEDAVQDALFGDDDGAGSPGAGGGAGTLARTAGTLARRQQARARLEAGEQQRRHEAEAERAAKIARLEEQAARCAASAQAQAAAADAKVAAWQARAAARAAAGSGKRPDGRAPAGADQNSHVRRARKAAGRAAAALARAQAEPAAAAAGKPAKINTTDPSSKVMQAKNGGFGQLHNIQALAGRRQVIYAIGAHPSPVDVAALHPLLKQGRATLDAAGIGDPIGTALFDAGYASDANFTADCQAELYVAVTREARQTGRLADGRKPKTMKDSWQQMAARLDTPEGKALYRQRAAIIEPVFAQLFARLGTRLNYRDQRVDLELHLWAASHNLLKAIRARRRRARQQRSAPAIAA
jgi:transposase